VGRTESDEADAGGRDAECKCPSLLCFPENLAIPARRVARGVQTGTVMLRPTAFIRTMVDSATVRPFWSALLDMKQARVRIARQTPVAAPTTSFEAPFEVEVVTPRAA
jgi:hypothetical protein